MIQPSVARFHGDECQKCTGMELIAFRYSEVVSLPTKVKGKQAASDGSNAA